MTSRTPFDAVVRARTVLSEHLVRLVLEAPDGFASTGVPDEWLALTVPGQFQTRYYTVRSLADGLLTIDVVVHERGAGHRVGADRLRRATCVGLSAPKGSFQLPPDAELGGAGRRPDRRCRRWRGSPRRVDPCRSTIHAEIPDEPLRDYVAAPVEWHHAEPGDQRAGGDRARA